MSFLVAHFRKVHTAAGLGKVANHNSRHHVYDESGRIRGEKPPSWVVNPDFAKFNQGHKGQRDETALRDRAAVIAAAGLKRKPQKNAAQAIEAVFSASPGAFTTASGWKEFFRDCREWAGKKFGDENVLQWNTHYDEKTPHMHLLFVPIIRDRRGNRYSSSEILGGRDGLRKIQDELAETIGKTHGLERGVRGSDKKHTNLAEWKAELLKKERDLARAQKEIAEKNRELQTRVAVYNAAIKNLKPAEQQGLKIGEELRVRGGQTADITPFWKIWAENLPGFVKYALDKVREAERIRTREQQQTRTPPERSQGRSR